MATPRNKSKEQALDYLQQRGLLTKPRDQYTDAYAKRLASQYKKAEAQGKELSRKEARGKHPKKEEPRVQKPRRKQPPTEKIVKHDFVGPLQKKEVRGKEHEKEQAIVHGPNVVKDLLLPLKMMGYPTKVDGAEWDLLVYGYAQQSSTNRKTWKPGKPVHYHIYVTEENLKYWLKHEPLLPILDFVNMYSEYKWTEILSISVQGYRL